MFQVLKIIFLLFLFVYSNFVFALKEDNKAIVHIVADSSIYNYKTGVNIFEGNVKVDQGTTHITADRLVTKSNRYHKIQEAIAYGIKQSAHYWTLSKSNEPEIHAKARLIKFYPIETDVVLEKEVVLTQGENSFHGQLILYNKNNQTIIVPAAKNSRAILVYNPSK